MKHIFSSLICSTLLILSTNGVVAAAESANTTTVLVSQDFTEALVRVLTADTACAVVRAIPSHYSPGVHAHYLKKHQTTFAPLASKADAVVSIASAWPADPLYPWARRGNIHIVHIDAVHPLDASRAGLPLLEQAGATMAPPVWTAPGNAARMADITASDLSRLSPKDSERITSNLDAFKRALFKLRSKYESAFGMLDTFEVVALTTDYMYLTDEFGITVVQAFLKPEIQWQPTDLDLFSRTIEENDIRGVVSAWEPTQAIAERIKAKGAKVIVLKQFKLKENMQAAEQLMQFYEANLARLLNGLSNR
ncbi:MAG: hypothetical protein CSA33_01835 [Desulfobulbus propionicus]|nr:MAG: hypothetical protein CSA33_01835 [Desulfobulbus propionicus]